MNLILALSFWQMTMSPMHEISCESAPPDRRCAVECWGYCHGYYYGSGMPDMNSYNPNCADVCCTSNG